MNDAKYIYRVYDGKTFRIHLSKNEDSTFGMVISYEIQEPASVPHNKWEQLKQFFTVATYSMGRWVPFLSNDTLEERLIQAMASVVKGQAKQDAAEKEWEILKNS